MGKITLTNIAEELATKSGLSREEADKFVRAFIATLEEGLRADNMVKVKGLGTFKLMQVSDRDSVDVSTGERITIKGYTKVSFTPDSAMKEFVNRPFAHFEPTELNEGYPTDEDLVLKEDLVDANEENGVAELMDNAVEASDVETVTEEVTDEVVVESTETVEAAEAVVDVETAEAVESAMAEAVEVDESLEAVPVAVEAEVAEEGVETMTAVDETIEASHTTEEVVEEAPVTEEAVDVQSEKVEEIASVTEEPETVSESSEEKPAACRKRKKRRGCGCIVGGLLVLFAVIAVVGGYLWMRPADETKGQGEIVVKTNLEEELGAEWGDDSKVEEPQSVEEQSDEVALPAPKDSVAEKQEEARTIVAEKTNPVAAEVAKPVAANPFCNVVITESLQEKTIKDITPADTTDYVLDGTLVTHTLKNGETIISLAKRYYGDKRLWPYIVKYNKMKNFNSVAIGQKINVPVLKEKTIE